jgi:spermidine synthase
MQAADTPVSPSPYRFVDRDDGYRLLMVEGADPTLCMTMMRLDDTAAVCSHCSTTMLQWVSFMPHAKDVVMIGLGGGEIPRFVHKHLPQTRLVAVEIDSAMVDMARQHFSLVPDDERLSVVVGDGAQYVRSLAPESCDVLLLDAYDNDYEVPPSLVSEEFSDICHGVLREGGVLGVNLLRRPAGWTNDYIRMLTDRFARVLHVRLDEQQVILLAFKNLPAFDWEQVHQRAQALEPEFRLQLPMFAKQLEKILQSAVLVPAPGPEGAA